MPLRLAPAWVLLVAVLCACGPGPAVPGPDRAGPVDGPGTAGPPAPGDEEQVAGEVPPPTGVRFPTIDVDATIVPVGVDPRGEMEVPTDVRTVGWYRFGSGAGEGRGSVVLAGHVDDRVQGRGAFYRLVELGVGDTVAAERADGTVVEYRVEAVQQVAKADLPVDQLFARNGREVLTLITCGGDFDESTRSYRENVVVTAHPTG